jgi:RNA polymerase sigma-70 factor (ECF subfamily)
VKIYRLAGLITAGVEITANKIRQMLVLSDSQLVALAKEGDHNAFDEIVRRHQDFVYRLALSYLHQREVARDVAQNVFVSAYKGIYYLRNESALRPWLYRICRNNCLNVIRRENLERKYSPEVSEADNPDLSLGIMVKEMISRLEDQYRQVIILRYYHDLKYKQIAELLGISLSSVKVRIFRAKSVLKKMLEER